MILLILTIIFLVGIIFGYLFFLVKRKKRKLFDSLAMTLFSIKMPKYAEKSGKERDIKSLIGMAEQIYSNFLYLKKPNFFSPTPRVTLEIASKAGEENIAFYVAVPKNIEQNLEKYIQGVYPGAVVERVPQDYTIFEPQGEAAGAFLKLKQPFYFSLPTYKNVESDPLSIITNAFGKISSHEGAAIQIVLKPTSLKLKDNGKRILASLREGKPLKVALAEVSGGIVDKSIDTFSKILLAKKSDQDTLKKKFTQKPILDEALINAIQAKIQKPIIETNIRLLGTAQTQIRATEILNYLINAFNQFTSVFNSFSPKILKKRKLKHFLYNFIFRNYDKVQKVVLNLEELCSIYHFPLPYLESPHIQWIKTKEAAPPTELPVTGTVIIGKTIFRGEEKPVYFASPKDRRRHFYIIGQTGVGKTALLQELIRQDIANGEGVGVLDPHGDLIEATLANIPKERANDVILFEPFDLSRPCGLNMLEWETPEQKDFAVSEMISIFAKLFPPEIIGPMFEHYMRNAMLALMADKNDPGTLVEIPRIFTDREFMERKLEKVKNPLVKSFWQKEWLKTTGQTRSDMLGYVVSKVGRFVENDMMRNIIGQAHSGFNFDNLVNSKKIFLANLSKGLTGEMNSSLLGLILVSKIQMATLRKGKIPLEQRRDFYLYLDEFQNFTTDSIATILAEARKYRLNLIIAHQFIAQLKEKIRDAVMGNVGNIAIFRVGAEDAEFLEKQFQPEFSHFDLLNLDNFQLIIKMMINGSLSSPFKMKTLPPKNGNNGIIELIKKISKLKYGRPRTIVEQEILERSQLNKS